MNLKVGDMIWLAFMRFGKWPAVEKAKILKAGPKQISTNHGNWDRSSPAICATREEALKRLRVLIEGKIDEAVTEVDSWRQKLAEVDSQIAGEVPQ
jgi:hypothetical protein